MREAETRSGGEEACGRYNLISASRIAGLEILSSPGLLYNLFVAIPVFFYSSVSLCIPEIVFIRIATLVKRNLSPFIRAQTQARADLGLLAQVRLGAGLPEPELSRVLGDMQVVRV